MEETKTTIAIDIAEYKELLMIKGRYEELKERQSVTPILYRENSDKKDIYDINKITCKYGGAY
jgi:hypothetical protein